MSLLNNSFGIGDRFAREAEAQLTALIKARDAGIDITPVWNKSFREHDIINSQPSETREKVDHAVKKLGWTTPYFVDADHINLKTVDFFLDHAKKQFNLPKEMKLSIHSGSDKFSLYPIIQKLSARHNQGIHLKTAGTTWLEEVIGLALAGGEALDMVKTIYRRSWERMDELCKPYQSVIHIDPLALPDPETVKKWSSEKFANSLRHIPDHPDFNPHFRQLIHIGYKVAAEMGTRFVEAIEKNHILIAQQVIQNLYERHILPLFVKKSE